MKTPIQIGSVFKSASSYWKIIGGVTKSGMLGETYPVIKCSKTGKEFRELNRFGRSYVENRVIIGIFLGEKADIDDGVESGIKKRRIQYLKKKIESFTKELKELEG